LTGEDKELKPSIKLAESTEVPGKSLGVERNSENQIAVVYAEGNIVDGQGGVGDVGGDRFARILRSCDRMGMLRQLCYASTVLAAATSEVIQREVRLTGQVKPVVVSMGNVAASGGYWIVTDAKRFR